MSIHSDANQSMRGMFATGVARVFSAFGRLASLYAYSTTSNGVDHKLSLESLAEIGLLNVADLQVELKHFLDFYTPF